LFSSLEHVALEACGVFGSPALAAPHSELVALEVYGF
jgi:hypothetical protein